MLEHGLQAIWHQSTVKTKPYRVHILLVPVPRLPTISVSGDTGLIPPYRYQSSYRFTVMVLELVPPFVAGFLRLF